MKQYKITAAVLAVSLMMTGCSRVSEEALKPVLGLQWYDSPEDVKEQLSDFRLLEERESVGVSGERQMLLDYDVTNFYDAQCTLTVCFTSLGLVGLNYHDIEHDKTYQEWSLALESVYGIPTEESKGLSAWYENPLGKNTCIYLFNLEEGVQISFYAEYSGSEKAVPSDENYDDEAELETISNIPPMPETRTPIVPIETEPPKITETQGTAAVSTEAVQTGTVMQTEQSESTFISTETAESEEFVSEEETQPEEPAEAEEGLSENTRSVSEVSSVMTTAVTVTTSAPAVTASSETTTVPPETEAPTEPPVYDPLNGLEFYMSPENGRRRMSGYSQLYEYRTEEPGQPWELIMEYENADFYQNQIQAVLCFTSLGLVGVNYFDENPGNYQYWTDLLTGEYDTPTDTQYDYTAWTNAPVGDGTQIYIFALEDGVQISFFADDTGSALS